MSPIPWLPSGRLSLLVTNFAGGVYLFVHEGPSPSVSCVGTAKRSTGFTPRWCGHLSLFACGGRTVSRTMQAARATPSERGETISVPMLLMKQGDFFEPFEKSHRLEVPSALFREEATLPTYAPAGPGGRYGGIDITEKGRVVSELSGFVPILQTELSLFARGLSWKEIDLVRWLDKQGATDDVTQEERRTGSTTPRRWRNACSGSYGQTGRTPSASS